MDSIANIFKERTALEKKHIEIIRSERDELIKKFHDTKLINITDRQTKKLRLANKAEVALILKDCPTTDLFAFFKECERANSFSRYFWWAVKGGKNKGAKKVPSGTDTTS